VEKREREKGSLLHFLPRKGRREKDRAVSCRSACRGKRGGKMLREKEKGAVLPSIRLTLRREVRKEEGRNLLRTLLRKRKKRKGGGGEEIRFFSHQ